MPPFFFLLFSLFPISVLSSSDSPSVPPIHHAVRPSTIDITLHGYQEPFRHKCPSDTRAHERMTRRSMLAAKSDAPRRVFTLSFRLRPLPEARPLPRARHFPPRRPLKSSVRLTRLLSCHAFRFDGLP